MGSKIKLYLFDLDGTLTAFDSDTLYPDAAAWLESNRDENITIVTNQGGVGLRYWMESEGFGDPAKYPTEDEFKARLNRIFSKVSIFPAVLMCFRYQSKKTGAWGPLPPGKTASYEWSANWRKPEPGMLGRAMILAKVNPEETLMVGDSEEDKEAAANAGCSFKWAWQFFGREKPEPAPTDR